VWVLEQIGSAEARKTLERLPGGAAAARQTREAKILAPQAQSQRISGCVRYLTTLPVELFRPTVAFAAL
jgi:hypothetical protein